jgi:hypothetical protein
MIGMSASSSLWDLFAMVYGHFTLRKVKQEFGLTIEERDSFQSDNRPD